MPLKVLAKLLGLVAVEGVDLLDLQEQRREEEPLELPDDDKRSAEGRQAAGEVRVHTCALPSVVCDSVSGGVSCPRICFSAL
jgi:hypothetical protein